MDKKYVAELDGEVITKETLEDIILSGYEVECVDYDVHDVYEVTLKGDPARKVTVYCD